MASVIIPTKDDSSIFTTLEKVQAQNPDEVLVVVEKSSQQTYKDALQKVDDVAVIEVDGGTAVARNTGVEEASSDNVVFLDADCYPQDGWLDAMVDALSDHDLVEGRVEYVGDRCPFNRLVENTGEDHRYLTANLGVRKDVFETVRFDDEYPIFREDTDFGWRALEAGFTSTFEQAAVVNHDAGRHTFQSFLRERFRYRTEPYFVEKFADSGLLETEVSQIGPFLYPLELGVLTALFVTLLLTVFTLWALPLTAGICVFLSSYYTYQKIETKDATFCLTDWLHGLYWIPLGLIVKRYAIWKGAVKYKVPLL